MQVPARPYVMAAAALAATGLVAVTPTALRLSAHRIVSMPTRLVDADSLLNVPFNLFQDLVNIPGTEVEAFEQFGNADLFPALQPQIQLGIGAVDEARNRNSAWHADHRSVRTDL